VVKNWLRKVSVATLAVLLPAAVSAAALDDYYLAKFGLLATGIRVATGVTTTTTATEPERCRTWLNHDLQRDWDELEPQTRKTLAKVLPARPALASEAVVLSNGGHFHIHYATSGADAPPLTDTDGNGIPDWVENVAGVFEAVYNREVTVMGFKAPPTGGNQPYDVYLQNVGSDPVKREFGETNSDTFVTAVSATSYVIIDNDFSAAEFGNQIAAYTPLKALQITAAHEFHHAIQFGYNFFFEPWYAEATSTWIEDEVYDSVNQLYNYLPQYMNNTTLPLDTAVDVTTGGGYGRWIFNRYLVERYLTSDVIKSFWERLAATAPPAGGADIPTLPTLEQTVAQLPYSGSLPNDFLGFAKRVYVRDWGTHQGEVDLIHAAVSLATFTSFPVTAPPTSSSVTLPHYSFAYYRFLPTSSAPKDLAITFSGKGSGINVVVFRKRVDNSIEQGFVFDSASSTITVPNFNDPITSEVVLLVCNSSANDSQSVTFSTDGTVFSPSNVTSGGGGGCFIATAAYGSYLHPKVRLLREFRDTWLMTNGPGRAIVRLYYRLSPPLAATVSRHAALRLAVRYVLAPVVWSLENKGGALLLGMLGVCSGGFVLLRRRWGVIAGTD
jgi:hypothetical protein